MKLVGVFGDPVAHSLSPAMHNAAFRALGLPYRYLKFHVPLYQLKKALRGTVALGFEGINLTIPLKEAALHLMDRVTREARRVGAVNTVTCAGGRLLGHNTDGEGFLRSLKEAWGFHPRGARVVVLGAGGAARAVAFALADAGTRELTLVNRTLGRATRLARAISRTLGVKVRAYPLGPRTDWPRLLGQADLLVNATSAGLKREPSLVPASALAPPLKVADLIYNPPETALLRVARRRGVKAINGTGMLLHQGALVFERWTHRRAPVEVMRRALTQALRI